MSMYKVGMRYAVDWPRGGGAPVGGAGDDEVAGVGVEGEALDVQLGVAPREPS